MSQVSAKPYEPLFTLQEHNTSVLTCSFYPVLATGRSNYEKCCSFFLSGDASGVVLLYDLEIRRAVLRFHPVTTAHTHNHAASLDPCVNTGILSVGFIALSTTCNQTSECACHTNHENHMPPPIISTQNGCSSGTDHSSTSEHDGVDKSSVSWSTGQGQHSTLASSTAERMGAVYRKVRSPQSSDDCTRRISASVPYSRFRLPRPRLTLEFRTDTCMTERRRNDVLLHSGEVLHFYTQCRNQDMYIWEYTMSNSARSGQHDTCDDARRCRLLYCLRVPQIGFCPVATCTSSSATYLYIAVPHDSGGILSLWTLEIRDTYDCAVCATCGHRSKDKHSNKPNSSYALQQKQRGLSAFSDSSSLCTFHDDNSALKLQSLGVFSASPSVVTGCIMRINLACNLIDSAQATLGRVGIAFESGHVALCTFSMHRADKTDNTVATVSPIKTSPHLVYQSANIQHASSPLPEVVTCSNKGRERVSAEVPHTNVCWKIVALHRAFPESALVCTWENDSILVTSVEGKVQCYGIAQYDIHPTTGKACDSGSAATDMEFCMKLRWELGLPRGLGSAAIQNNLVILGGWDNTLRLYDIRNGHVITILPFHKGSVNDVAVLSSLAANTAPFAYDMRQTVYRVVHSGIVSPNLLPQSDSKLTLQNKDCFAGNYSLCDDTLAVSRLQGESGVYIFASVSRDNTIAIWRLDFGQYNTRQ